jgi:hypothetical protein
MVHEKPRDATYPRRNENPKETLGFIYALPRDGRVNQNLELNPPGWAGETDM